MKKIFKSIICQILIMGALSLPVQSSMYEQVHGGGSDYSSGQPVVESGLISLNAWSGDPTRRITIGMQPDSPGNLGSPGNPDSGNVTIDGGSSKMYTLNVLHTTGDCENAGVVVDQESISENFCALGIDCGTKKTKVAFLENDMSRDQNIITKLLENAISKYMNSSLPVISEDDLFALHNNAAKRIGRDDLFNGSAFSGLTSYAVDDSVESPSEVAVVNNVVLNSEDEGSFFLKKAPKGYYPVWDKVSSISAPEVERYYNEQEMGYLAWAERLISGYSSHNEGIFEKLKNSPNMCIVLSVSSTTSPTNRQRIVAALKYVLENIHGINAGGNGLRYYVLDSVEATDISYLYEHNYVSNSIVCNIGQSELSLSGVDPYARKVYDTEGWYGLGGSTIDRILCDYFEKKVKDELEVDVDERMRMDIQKAVVIAKEQLSADGASVVRFDPDFKDYDFECEFSIDEFNELLVKSGFIERLKEKVRDYCVRFIANSGVYNTPITAVFSGGAIRSPIIKRSIIEALADLGVESGSQSTLNFDECSAYGGCYALLLKNKPAFVEDYTDKVADLNPDVLDSFNDLLSEYSKKIKISKMRNALEAYIYNIQGDGTVMKQVAYNRKTLEELASELLAALKSRNAAALANKLNEIDQGIRSLADQGDVVRAFHKRISGFLSEIR